MIRLGITGGIGSGKSTVCRCFQLLGVPVYYADLQAKRLIENDKTLVEEIKQLLGNEAYKEGCYQPKYVAQQAFNNKHILKELNALVHPAVMREWELWSEKRKTQPIIIKEAAIMRSARLDDSIDAVLYVHTPSDERLRRVLERDIQRTEESIVKIMNNQRSEEDYRAIADYVINNHGELIIPQVLSINKRLRK